MLIFENGQGMKSADAPHCGRCHTHGAAGAVHASAHGPCTARIAIRVAFVDPVQMHELMHELLGPSPVIEFQELMRVSISSETLKNY
jgi:hypothetical protein